MRIGVPGEFHEDRWPRTAEDHREACVSATREAEGAHRIQVIAWRSVLLTGLRPDLRPYSWPLRSGSGSRSALRHGDLACRCLSGIPAWRRSHLSGLRHGHPAHRYLSGIPSWQSVLLIVLRLGDIAHRCLSGIPAWRSDTKPMPNRSMNGVNGWLRHGHPAYRHLSGIPAWRSIIQPVSDRSLSDALVGPSARRPSSKASQGLVLCNEYRSGDFRVREG